MGLYCFCYEYESLTILLWKTPGWVCVLLASIFNHIQVIKNAN